MAKKKYPEITWSGVLTLGPTEPIPMLLTCPSCGERHVDEGEFATKLHHTHACQKCGMVWRPAVLCTVGVRFLPGFKNVLALIDHYQEKLDKTDDEVRALRNVAREARALYVARFKVDRGLGDALDGVETARKSAAKGGA